MFKTRKKLKKHNYRNHRNKCDVCQKCFVSIISLKEHVDQEHTETEIAADLDDTETQSTARKCDICVKEFLCDIQLEEHTEAEHKEQTNITEDGNRNYKTTFAQESYEEMDNSDGIGKELIPSSSEYKCEICRIYFEGMKDLENHLDKIHLEELECVFCKIEFQGINDMDTHMDLKHNGMWKLNDPDILREGDSEYQDEFEEMKIRKKGKMGEILYCFTDAEKHVYLQGGDC
jgi:hypothetical protein